MIVDEKDIGASERRSELAGAMVVTAYTAALGVALAPATPLVGVVAGSTMLLACGVTLARNKWGVAAGLAEHRLVRSLRKQRGVDGLVVPLTMVQSQEGVCCAYDHVVYRCEPCACVRPCTALGGRFRGEDRGTGRFLVRGAEHAVLVQGHEARFEASLYERSSSHFHRLDAGERVRIRGDFEETSELPDDVRAVLGSLRDLPRVLVPRAGTAVLIEKLR